jgi:hypothetical protein
MTLTTRQDTKHINTSTHQHVNISNTSTSQTHQRITHINTRNKIHECHPHQHSSAHQHLQHIAQHTRHITQHINTIIKHINTSTHQHINTSPQSSTQSSTHQDTHNTCHQNMKHINTSTPQTHQHLKHINVLRTSTHATQCMNAIATHQTHQYNKLPSTHQHTSTH